MFELASVGVFVFLAVTWRRSDPFNTSLKLAFTGMSLWGLFETALAFGYVVPALAQ